MTIQGRIGIIGGGIGGLTAAIALTHAGHEVSVFEQSRQYLRVGADINLTPNAVHALDGLGVDALSKAIRASAARPTFRISRTWDTGEETSRLAMSDEAEQRYGAPQLTIHRADLLAALADAFPIGQVHFAQRVRGVAERSQGAAVVFDDGTEESFDVVIGADGIHSVVRASLFGAEKPRFTGVVAFRAVVPRERVAELPDVEAFTKWWGPTPESQIVTFPLNRGRDVFIFATTAQDSWHEESWTTPGSVEELRELYAGFHPHAQALLAACDEVLKTALYERDALAHWSAGHVTLLGDAAHPMMPFMAQGAGMAIEDAIVLGQQLKGANVADVPQALRRYEAERLPRASRVQRESRSNNWLRAGGNADWLYGYDAWAVPEAAE